MNESVSSRFSVKSLQQKKQTGQKITMLTVYDYSFARIFDLAGIDILLVGDSAANVMAGFNTTLPITLEQMIYHAQSVVRAAKKSMVVVDLPFGTYQINEDQALQTAIQVMKETGAQAIKLEGGASIVSAIKKIVSAGIPVIGHLGLTPQSIHQFGSYGVQAKEESAALQLKKDISLLENAGCIAIVVEKIPAILAKELTAQSGIPIIGIGAGNSCDGQVLVMHDLLGMNSSFKPKFVRNFVNLESIVNNAVTAYIDAVNKGEFPNAAESY